MNVVFISPQFPPHFVHFVTALRERGIQVLGIGDAPYDSLRHELRNALTEYYFTPRLDDADAMQCATAYFIWRHGRIGYPLVLKPDVGVGAAHTFMVASDAEVDSAFSQPLSGYAAQKYVKGTIVTYDGMVNAQGQIVCAFSHEYSNGIMETVLEKRDLSIWSLREIPPALENLGHRTVAALGLREPWFHLEFFRLEDGSFVALEANLRPPGSFLTDMMNYACDIDVYQLWARMLSGDPVSGFQYTRKYHVCHTARRAERSYKHPHPQVVQQLGPALLEHRDLPAVFHDALGHELYLSRHQELDSVREAARFIQTPA